jgi:hypothetical protein
MRWYWRPLGSVPSLLGTITSAGAHGYLAGVDLYFGRLLVGTLHSREQMGRNRFLEGFWACENPSHRVFFPHPASGDRAAAMANYAKHQPLHIGCISASWHQPSPFEANFYATMTCRECHPLMMLGMSPSGGCSSSVAIDS